MAGGQVLVCLLIWIRLELARQAASGIHRAWPIYSINTVDVIDDAQIEISAMKLKLLSFFAFAPG